MNDREARGRSARQGAAAGASWRGREGARTMRCACVLSALLVPGLAWTAALSPMRGADVNYRPMRAFDDAAWVGAKKPGGRQFFRLRRDFDSDGAPLALYVSADERYVLLLDGEEISRGPARGLVSHWFCQRVAARPKAGRHRLEAVVWTLGDEAPTAQLSWRGGFFLKAEGAYDVQLTTGKAVWRLAPLAGTATDGRTFPGAFGGGTQFKVAGTSVLDEEPAADAWTEAAVVSAARTPGLGGWGMVPAGWAVYESRLPEMMMRPVKPGEIPKTALTVPAHARREWLFDLGDYYCAYPYLTVEGGKGAKIRFGFSECLVDADGKKIHRDARNGAFTQAVVDTFLPDGRAKAVFTVPWWRCGKWCRLEVETGAAPLTIADVTLKETRYPIRLDGSPACARAASRCARTRSCSTARSTSSRCIRATS